MTSPNPDLVAFQQKTRRLLIKAAAQQGWSLALLNDGLTRLGLAVYRTNGDLLGTVTVDVAIAFPGAVPTADQVQPLLRVDIPNSPLNNTQLFQRRAFSVVAVTAAGVRLRVFLAAQRDGVPIANVESLVSSALQVAPYSAYLPDSLPAVGSRTVVSFTWDDPDPDDPTQYTDSVRSQ
jgi:hypothetical protein